MRRGAVRVALLTTLLFSLTGCGEQTGLLGTSTTAPSPSDEAGTELQVVTGDGGASVAIPASEVPAEAVSVVALEGLEGLYPTGDPASFAGGVRLEPHGLAFDRPVTVTIPLVEPQQPGRVLRLYYWDGSGTAWEETAFTAVVATDGRSASGEVTHFSYYILQPSAIGAEEDGIFGNVEGTVSVGITSGQDQATATREVFEQAIAHVNARFPLYSPVPLHVPVVNGYNCYQPVGLYFQFDHGSEGIERPLTLTIGDIDDVEFRIDYLREVDVTIKYRDYEAQVVGSLVANVYWQSRPPVMDLKADHAALWAGETAWVTVELTCAGIPMETQEIDFALTSDPTHVWLSEELEFTTENGTAATEVLTTEEAVGTIVVQAEHLWTDQPGDVSTMLTDTVTITVGSPAGTWNVSGRETWSNCTDPEDNGTWRGSGSVFFQLSGGSLTGRGNFPRTSETITGTVTRSGPDGFTVTGTTRYEEDWGECGPDGCYEWIVSGTSRFTGRGSISSGTIDFTWEGQDRVGDTCTFTGEGTATRR